MENWEASHVATDTHSLASLFRHVPGDVAARRPVSIDDLLTWAYRIELVRREHRQEAAGAMRSSDTLAMLRALGTRVQLSGWVGGGHGFVEDTNPPDADALRINAAVQRLDDLVIDRDAVGLTDDAAFAELTDAERDAAYAAGRARVLDGAGRFRSSLAAFVIAGAVLGRPRPLRLAEPVKRIEVAATNGTRMWFRTVMQSAGAGRPAFPVEVSGFNHRRQRPYPDAYRKFRLEPAPAPIVAERIEYQAWRYALDVLISDLSGTLERFEPIASRAPWWPWQRGYDASEEKTA